MNDSYADIAKMVDHALLTPSLDERALLAGCELARTYDVASVCVMPYYLQRAAELLASSTVLPSTTIGFPHGVCTTTVKVAEALQALEDGGRELDMVVNTSRVVSGDWAYVHADIRAVLDVTHSRGQKIKVIFETAYLNEAQKIRLCELCSELGADWVKTSTGFAPAGSTPADLALMRKHTKAAVQVKASGGIRDLEQVLEARKLGASRVGTSRTAEILDECRRRLKLAPLAVHDASRSAPVSNY